MVDLRITYTSYISEVRNLAYEGCYITSTISLTIYNQSPPRKKIMNTRAKCAMMSKKQKGVITNYNAKRYFPFSGTGMETYFLPYLCSCGIYTFLQ